MSSPHPPKGRDSTPLHSPLQGQGRPSCKAPASSTLTDSGSFVSFEHVPDARARNARQCAQELYGLASRYPELARHIHKTIKVILKEAARTKSSDRDRVLAALEASCHTYAEIAEHSGLPYQTVYKIVNSTELVLFVELRLRSPSKEPGRGGPRRPEVLIFLK